VGGECAGEDGTVGGGKLDVQRRGTMLLLIFKRRFSACNLRGVSLAVNSKNNYEDAMHIIENHPHMVLKKEYFSSMRINGRLKPKTWRKIRRGIEYWHGQHWYFSTTAFSRGSLSGRSCPR
jgi:predicted enzyme involved in methoxymalonyl-ACP biosynthesis